MTVNKIEMPEFDLRLIEANQKIIKLEAENKDLEHMLSSCVDWDDRQLLDIWAVKLREMAEVEIDNNGGVILDSCSNEIVIKLIGLSYLIDKWAESKHPMYNKCSSTCDRKDDRR